MLMDHVERQTDPEEEGEGVSRGGEAARGGGQQDKNDVYVYTHA